MEKVIEIQDVPFHEGEKRLTLGTAAMLDDVLTHPQCPVFLHSALCGKLSWQKRSEFSIAQTLTAPGLAPQWIGALLAWGALAAFEDGREQPLVEVMAAAGNAKRVTALSLPLEIPGRLWAEARTGSTPRDFPVVWAMAVVDLENGSVKHSRVALSGVWRQSVALAQSAGLLIGSALRAEAVEKVASAIVEEVTPKGDYRGSAEYRKAMAGVMTRRALQACLEGEEA